MRVVAAGAASVLVAAGTGAWFAVHRGRRVPRPRERRLASVVALAVLAAGLVAAPRGRRSRSAIALLGAEYVAILGFEADALDTRAPLVAGALLAVAELAYWSLELRVPVVDEAGTYLRRIALLATLVARRRRRSAPSC